MAKRFLVQTDFTAKDNLSPAMKKMGRGFGRFAANITDKNSVIGRSFNSVNKTINRAIGVGLIALTAAVGVAANQYVQLDNAVTAAGAKFKDVNVTATDFKDNLNLISQAARAVGADTEYSAVDAAGALDKFAMAGFTSVQSMALLRGTTDLATVANTDLTTAVDIATDSLGAFNLMTEDAAQLQLNLARISDVMAKTTVTANTSLEDMFEAVKAGAPAFTAAGQQLETFAAFTGVMANAGIKGASAGTSLRNVMLRLADPSAEAAKVLKKLGVVTQDSQGNFRDAIDILADFEKGLGGMGTAQRTAALSTVFGARTVTGINILLAEGSDALRTYRGDLIAAGGSAADIAAGIRSSLGNQIEVLKSGLIELGLKFVEAFDKDGRGALAGIIDFVQNLDITPVVNFATAVVDVLKFIGSHWKVVLSLAGGIKAVAIAIGIAQLAASLFNKSLQATPLGVILTVVGLLIPLIILLATHWDQVTDAFKTGVTAVAGFFRNLGVSIKESVMSDVALFLEIWEEPIRKLGEMFGKLWENISDGFHFIFDPLIEFFKQFIDPIVAGAEKIGKFLGIGQGAGSAAGAPAYAGYGNYNTSGIGGMGTPATPTPMTAGTAGVNGSFDINFNNLPGNASPGNRRNIPKGVNININPSISP